MAKLDVHATIEHPLSRRLLMNGQKVEVMDVVQTARIDLVGLPS